METGSTADYGDYLGIIGQLRSKKYNGNKNQDRHKGNHQIHHPVRIKMDKEIAHREAIIFYPRCFGLHINNDYNNRDENQHKT